MISGRLLHAGCLLSHATCKCGTFAVCVPSLHKFDPVCRIQLAFQRIPKHWGIIWHTFVVPNSFASPHFVCFSSSRRWKTKWEQLHKRAHPGLNQGPLGLQPNALPLSYRPSVQRMRKVQHLYLHDRHVSRPNLVLTKKLKNLLLVKSSFGFDQNFSNVEGGLGNRVSYRDGGDENENERTQEPGSAVQGAWGECRASTLMSIRTAGPLHTNVQ